MTDPESVPERGVDINSKNSSLLLPGYQSIILFLSWGAIPSFVPLWYVPGVIEGSSETFYLMLTLALI